MDAPRARTSTLFRRPLFRAGRGRSARAGEMPLALNYRDKMVIEGTMPIPLRLPVYPGV